MTDSQVEIERAVAALTDREELDWVELAKCLSAKELAALRVLEAAQLEPARPVALEQGFETKGELGQGSMGRVRRALDRSLAREVALKIIRPERNLSPQARANFVAEARLLASIRHAGIVQVFSIHEQEGEIQMALELIEGRTLGELVQSDGPLSCAEAARVGIELCRALAALHARGITHRDLKPANVMRENGGRIVLLDFGIARSPGSSAALPGGAGTPRFMSPEQFARGPLGPHTDLWSLGALLYWLVSARFPFEGENLEAVRQNVLAGRGVPLLDRRSDVDPRFAALIERALAREVSGRPKSAGDFEHELRALASVSSPAPAPRAVLSRSAVGWVCAALLFLAAAGAWMWSSRSPSRLFLEANFFVKRMDGAVLLREGDTVRAGEGLFLEVGAPDPFYLYVLNADDEGRSHMLFPAPGYEPTNPLRGGERLRLPGRYAGGKEHHEWIVGDDGGGGESLLLVASLKPVDALEALLSVVPPVQPGATPDFPELPAATRDALLRGIGVTLPTASQERSAKGAENRPLDLVTLLEELNPDPDLAIRTLRLRTR